MGWVGGMEGSDQDAASRGSLLEREHYEVLGDAGHGWSLLALIEDRADAVVEARSRFAADRFIAVRVVRSSYDAAQNEFREREVLHLGERRRVPAGAPVEEDIGPICGRVEHLYTAQARRTVRRLLGDWLGRHHVTTIELLHHPEHHQRLEGAGLLLQSAVQRAARAQAGATGGDVQKRLRDLFLLTDEASMLIRRLCREGRALQLADGDLPRLASALAGEADRVLLFNIAVTAEIRPLRSLADKLGRLFVLLAGTRSEQAVALMDGYLGAFLEEGPVVAGLLGSQTSLGTAAVRLVDMLAGMAPPGAGAAVERLCQGVWLDELPRCREALVRRLVAILRGPRALAEHDLDAEVAVHRALHDRIEAVPSDSPQMQEIRAALVERCGRLVSPTGVARVLDGKTRPEARFRLLLRLAPGIFGDANRLRLGDLIMSELDRDRVDYGLLGKQATAVERMCELRKLQRQVDDAGLLPAHHGAIADRLDAFCCELIRASRLFDRLGRLANDPLEKAISVLRLCRRGAFTRGAALGLAERHVRGYLKQPGGLDRLTGAADEPDKRRRLLELRELLSVAGVDDALD